MPDAGWSGDEAQGPLVWRSWWLRLGIALVPAWLTLPILISNVDGPIKVIVAIVLGVTLVSPRAGLLLVALSAPLGEVIGQLIGARTFRIAEVIVLTFLAGWLLRPQRDRRGPRVAAPAAAWLLAATIVASVAGLAWRLGRYPGELETTVDQLSHIYFFITDPLGFVDAARLLEGIGLVTATVMLFRRHPTLARTLPLALATSAALAALSSLLLWRGIGTATALARFKLIGYRVSGHVSDVNAAGSYFAMVVCLALGMAIREHGRRRALWIFFTAAGGVGLWFSESRSALGAAFAVIAVAVAWSALHQYRARTRAVALAVVVLVLLGGALFRVRSLDADPSYRGGGFRQQFVLTSLRMISARPLFGVGEGQYYRSSPLFLSPQLAFTYGAENAHNFFLQIGAELGLAGLAWFTWWLAAAMVVAARAIARAPRDARLIGISGGVAVFAATCVSGHPLLVGEIAYPFWMQVGLMTALAGSTLLNRRTPAEARAGHAPAITSRTHTALAAVAIVILVWSPIATARGAEPPAGSRAVDGFYGWETLEDGTRFRWTGAYASVFVPAGVTRVEIPVRVPVDGRNLRPVGVEVMIGGVDRGRTIVDGGWATLSLPLPTPPPPARFMRIDLRVDRVWQPALYIAGSADLRMVGVQVGEPRLFRD
jgi:O-antigen ligase